MGLELDECGGAKAQMAAEYSLEYRAVHLHDGSGTLGDGQRLFCVLRNS
jgi:hypothetical protein